MKLNRRKAPNEECLFKLVSYSRSDIHIKHRLNLSLRITSSNFRGECFLQQHIPWISRVRPIWGEQNVRLLYHYLIEVERWFSKDPQFKNIIPTRENNRYETTTRNWVTLPTTFFFFFFAISEAQTPNFLV